MSKATVNLKVAANDLDSFVLCLALGILEAMNSKTLPFEAGIWTLGRPTFWEPLQRLGLPEEVIEIFQEADELDALEKLSGRALAEARLEQMLGVVRSHLKAVVEKG